jgi:hypothetical protein
MLKQNEVTGEIFMIDLSLEQIMASFKHPFRPYDKGNKKQASQELKEYMERKKLSFVYCNNHSGTFYKIPASAFHIIKEDTSGLYTEKDSLVGIGRNL